MKYATEMPHFLSEDKLYSTEFFVRGEEVTYKLKIDKILEYYFKFLKMQFMHLYQL